MALVHEIHCDGPGCEKVQHISFCWRGPRLVKLKGRLAFAEDYENHRNLQDIMAFCSWSCVGKYATEKTDAEWIVEPEASDD